MSIVQVIIVCFSSKAKTLSKPEPVQTGIKPCPQGIPVWTGFTVHGRSSSNHLAQFQVHGSLFRLGASFSVTNTVLFNPGLPYKFGGKLLFFLCRTCAETESAYSCTCSNADRTIHGTLCTPELQKAVELGYRII